ncbi:MAG: macro domain-containing protein [Anaerolineae bacterium]|nr:macro domain-containing protein [Anaerolineae bacterium]
MKAKINKITIQILQGDLFALPVNGIVTVTDPNLHVDPILAKRAGPALQTQTESIRWSDVGTAVITDAGNLKHLKKIIHAVGPRWGDESARAKLGLVTWESLSLAEQHELKAIALPPISVGALGYPLENCAKTMLEQIIDFTFEQLKSLRTVILCVEDARAFAIFEAEFQTQLETLKETGDGEVVLV